MTKYESIVIMNPSLDENGIKELTKKFEDLINTLGKVEDVTSMGKKKLAYEINKQKEGYYVLYTFDAEPNSISELERNYRITDNVMKFITTKKEEK